MEETSLKQEQSLTKEQRAIIAHVEAYKNDIYTRRWIHEAFPEIGANSPETYKKFLIEWNELENYSKEKTDKAKKLGVALEPIFYDMFKLTALDHNSSLRFVGYFGEEEEKLSDSFVSDRNGRKGSWKEIKSHYEKKGFNKNLAYHIPDFMTKNKDGYKVLHEVKSNNLFDDKYGLFTFQKGNKERNCIEEYLDFQKDVGVKVNVWIAHTLPKLHFRKYELKDFTLRHDGRPDNRIVKRKPNTTLEDTQIEFAQSLNDPCDDLSDRAKEDAQEIKRYRLNIEKKQNEKGNLKKQQELNLAHSNNVVQIPTSKKKERERVTISFKNKEELAQVLENKGTETTSTYLKILIFKCLGITLTHSKYSNKAKNRTDLARRFFQKGQIPWIRVRQHLELFENLTLLLESNKSIKKTELMKRFFEEHIRGKYEGSIRYKRYSHFRDSYSLYSELPESHWKLETPETPKHLENSNCT